MTISLDKAGEHFLDHLRDKNYPEGSLVPYEEFGLDGKTYYFTPGGFLYRRGEYGAKEVGGLFARSLTDKFRHYVTDHS